MSSDSEPPSDASVPDSRRVLPLLIPVLILLVPANYLSLDY